MWRRCGAYDAVVGIAAFEVDVGDVLSRLVSSLPVILVVAWLAGRLLGARRSLGTTLLSGVVGWATGASLALLVARSEAGGFTRNLWLFSIVFTMSASVWVELLAKPGALARARSGLAVPRPLRALRRRSQRVGRYFEITRIAAKHGLGPYIGVTRRGDDDVADGKPDAAHRLRRALEECGGLFIKLGQVLSTRSDLVPPSFVRELSRLQDRVGPADQAAVRALLENELGAPVDQVFAAFDWRPVAAASIGQAHKARLRTGQPVIVKVQRPGIAEAVERDIQVLLELARTVEARTSWAAEFQVRELATEFADRLREELDFRIEARNASDIAANLAGMVDVRIPRVHGELTTPRVLVMDWLDGVSARDTAGVDALGVDRKELAGVLLRCALQQMLVDGVFHADPHPGNVMVLGDRCLGLIDFGAAGRLDPLEQTSLREVMLAVSQRDAGVLRQAVLEVAVIRRDFDDDQFERALTRFMARHLGPGAVPSAAMFNELLQLFFAFGITLPPSFSTFFRALVTLEGTLTTLSPGYLVIEEAQRVVGEWTRDRLTPTTLEDIARREVISLVPLLRRLPRHADRLATIVERGNLTARVSLLSDERDVQLVTKLLNRAVLAFLGGVVGILSVILLSIEGGPAFTGTTSLFHFFGYFGLFCATILILRVLVAVLQDGLN